MPMVRPMRDSSRMGEKCKLKQLPDAQHTGPGSAAEPVTKLADPMRLADAVETKTRKWRHPAPRPVATKKRKWCHAVAFAAIFTGFVLSGRVATGGPKTAGNLRELLVGVRGFEPRAPASRRQWPTCAVPTAANSANDHITDGRIVKLTVGGVPKAEERGCGSS